MRRVPFASCLLATGIALRAFASGALGQELDARPPQRIVCPLVAYNLLSSHHGTLSIVGDGAMGATIAVVPDYMLGIPQDQWMRWSAAITHTPYYWYFVPTDGDHPTLMLMKRLEQPGVTLGVLEPPLPDAPYIRCWIPK